MKNLTRSDPRLDWKRRVRVTDSEWSFEDALADAKQEVEEKQAAVDAKLQQLRADKQQAMHVAAIRQSTDMIPLMAQNTDNMKTKLDELHAAICQGNPNIDPALTTENGKNSIRFRKATLTNKFQAYHKGLGKTCGQVDAELAQSADAAERAAECVQTLKQTWDKKNADRCSLEKQVRTLKAELEVAKTTSCSEPELKRLKLDLGKSENLLKAAREESKAAKKEWEEARPTRNTRPTLQQLEQDAVWKLMQADLALAKGTLRKATDEHTAAKRQLGRSKSDLDQKAHAAKIGKASKTAQDLKQAAVQEHKRCQAALCVANLAKCEAEQHHSKVARDLKHYKQFGKLPSESSAPALAGPVEVPAEAPAEAAAPDGHGRTEEEVKSTSSSSSSSSAEQGEEEKPAEDDHFADEPEKEEEEEEEEGQRKPKRSHKRKDLQVPRGESPPGANRNERCKLAKARTCPKQGKLGEGN